MEVLTWVLVGGITAGIATRVGRSSRSSFLGDFLIGLGGAVLAGLAMSTFGAVIISDSIVGGAVAAVAGAVLAITIRRRIRRRSGRRGSFVGPFYAP